MKRRKIILLFLLSFVGGFVAIVLLYKNFKIGSNTGPLNWKEIYDRLHVFFFGSLFGAFVLTFRYYADKYGNKKEK